MKSRQVQLFVFFCLLFLFHASAATLYVNLSGTNPVPPYADWTTAATDIQSAVDAATDGDLILVTNKSSLTNNIGVYQTGGRVVYGSLTNRVVIDKAVTVQSVNGPSVTMIQGNSVLGDSAVRCVYMTNGATLIGFTLINGGTRGQGDMIKEKCGGGIWCESTNVSISNCIIAGNSAQYYGSGAYSGTLNDCTIVTNSLLPTGVGAAYNSTLYNCLIISNYFEGANSCWLSNCVLLGNSGFGGNGGGAANSTLISCTIVSNSTPAAFGGGVYLCVLTNCTLIGNSTTNVSSTPGYGGGAFGSILNNCTLIGNSATFGGAASGGNIPGTGTFPMVLNNCMICSNAAQYGGGVYGTSSINYTNCILNNCTLTFNSAGGFGGGAVLAELNNCAISNNTAIANNGYGGGAEGGLLNNCILTGNIARNGGGADGRNVGRPILNNCTLAGNVATNSGGASICTLNNCIIYYNQGQPQNNSGNILNYCCTPDPGSVGCITNVPLFVDLASGDFHLQTNSPCINAGNNAYVSVTNDLDGNPRISGGTVDMGAYEFQNPASIISYAWLQQYGLPTDGSADYADTDGTGMNNWQKWIAGLNPTNPASVLVMLSPVPTNNPSGLVVSWQSVNTRTYYLQSSTNLGTQPTFSTIQSNILGQAGTTSYTDTTATNGGPYFYRVGVQ